MAVYLAEGEEVVRTYRCASVDLRSSNRTMDALAGLIGRRSPTDCTVTVTNRRVIYFAESENASKATGMPAIHTQEAFLDHVSGAEFVQAESRMDLGPSLILIIVGLVFCLMALQSDIGWAFYPGIVMIAVGLILLISQRIGTKRIVLMRISTEADPCGGVHVSGLSRREEDAMAFYMVPTEDFERMAKEIGAMILDLQSKGDEAIASWKVR